MTNAANSNLGKIVWVDLTIPNASEVRNFYQQVVGWDASDVPVGDHVDYNMTAPGTEDTIAGICHALGDLVGTPPQWMIYIAVEDIDQSVAACESNGGKVVIAPKSMGGYGRYCVIQDPGGAVAALMEMPPEPTQ
jgi:uncharacterized protein